MLWLVITLLMKFHRTSITRSLMSSLVSCCSCKHSILMILYAGNIILYNVEGKNTLMKSVISICVALYCPSFAAVNMILLWYLFPWIVHKASNELFCHVIHNGGFFQKAFCSKHSSWHSAMRVWGSFFYNVMGILKSYYCRKIY